MATEPFLGEVKKNDAPEIYDEASNFRPVKFNRKGFLRTLGFGFVSVVTGLIFFESAKSEHDSDELIFRNANPIGFDSIFPESAKDILLFLLGNGLMLLGVICIFIGLKMVVRYISEKLRY